MLDASQNQAATWRLLCHGDTEDVCDLLFAELWLGMLQCLRRWLIRFRDLQTTSRSKLECFDHDPGTVPISKMTASHVQWVRRHSDGMRGTDTYYKHAKTLLPALCFAHVRHFAAFCILQRNFVTSFHAMSSRGGAERKHPRKLENRLTFCIQLKTNFGIYDHVLKLI